MGVAEIIAIFKKFSGKSIKTWDAETYEVELKDEGNVMECEPK